jgi:hypothetical protein
LAESQTEAVAPTFSLERTTNHHHTVATASLPASGMYLIFELIGMMRKFPRWLKARRGQLLQKSAG